MFVIYAYSCFFTTSVFVKLEAVSLGHRWRTRETTPQEQEMVKREIESTDKQIDMLVHELYGLSEDEIKIIEGG